MKKQLSGTVQQLLAEPQNTVYQQAIYLLEEAYLPKNLEADTEQLYLTPAAEISFPGADIKRVHADRQGNLNLELTFMGLYGVDSPLPLYFSALAIQDNIAAERLRKFVSLINHRFYVLYYLAWKKYQAHLQLEHKTNAYLVYLRAISGDVLESDDQQEYAYAGLFGARSRNSPALANLLQDFLGAAVTIKNFQEQWVQISAQPTLGDADSLVLGDNILVGNHVLDVTGKIAIEVKQIASDYALQLLPHQPLAKRLAHLIRRYLPPTISFDLILKIAAKKNYLPRLGQSEICLGWSSWLGEQTADNYAIQVNGL